ncbi:MAG: AAA family ATPase [Dehalococcoidia bacterium]
MRQRPYRVVLFDEIEKAHPDVFNTLLQVMDNGRLTDSQGRVADFRNTVIILTSNLGTGQQAAPLGFVRTKNDGERVKMTRNVEEALAKAFRPEFLNRLDEVVVFEPLTEAEIARIADLILAEVGARLAERGVRLEVSAAARSALVRRATTHVQARPMRRAIRRRIENELARRVLGGEFEPGDAIEVGVDADGAYTFSRVAAEGRRRVRRGRVGSARGTPRGALVIPVDRTAQTPRA